MLTMVTDAMRAPGTPDEVRITTEAPEPFWDPTLGIPVTPARGGRPPHRLVTIGDSLTHGFQSGAVFHTDLSYPAIVASELGWLDHFRYPTYPGFGGLPLNIELLVRTLEDRFGHRLDWWELPLALFRAYQFLDQHEDYWERGPGSLPPRVTGINHNLGIYGWDLRDVLARTAASCEAERRRPRDNVRDQRVENDNLIAALRVLPTEAAQRSLTVLGAAKALGDEGGDHDGIETLVVILGSNNALQSVVDLNVRWSDDGYDDLERKKPFTVWRPSHFAAELALLAEQVATIKARHVIWGTVPHVTIAPIARGVGDKVRPGSRYFPYYTRPWITAEHFDPRTCAHITENQARAIDSAIDQYNGHIAAVVRNARRAGKDWYVLDLAGILDRLANRRYLEDPEAKPSWWRDYELPAELAALQPVPTSRFFASGSSGRTDGGLFSLDGVHPTTIAYGILAQEVIDVMRLAGVTFDQPDGSARPDPVKVDFARLLRRDTLIAQPPISVTSDLQLVSWADETLRLIKRTVSFAS